MPTQYPCVPGHEIVGRVIGTGAGGHDGNLTLVGALDQPRILLTTEAFLALWRGTGRISSNPAIGLEFASEGRREHFEPMALAALSTHNFGESVRQMARYKQLASRQEQGGRCS